MMVPTPRYPKAISPQAMAGRGLNAEAIDSMTGGASYRVVGRLDSNLAERMAG